PAGERQGVRGKYGVASAGDVNGLSAAVNGYLQEAIGRFEQGRAVPPTGDQERLQFHFGKGRVTRTREFSGILAYRRVMLRLKLGLVWRGGSNARFRVAVQMVARVKRNEQCALALCRCLLNKFRSGDTKPVVR